VLHRLLVGVDGVVQLALQRERLAQQQPGVGVVRVARRGVAHERLGLVEPVLPQQELAGVVGVAGLVGIQRPGLLPVSERVVAAPSGSRLLAALVEGPGEVLLEDGLVGAQGQRLLQQRHGLVGVAGVQRGARAVVEVVDVVGGRGQQQRERDEGRGAPHDAASRSASTKGA
jgi:hypothetical protein